VPQADLNQQITLKFWVSPAIHYCTKYLFVVEIPSFFLHPLAPSVVHKPPPGSLTDKSRYPTWRLSSKDLQTVLDSLWDSLEPQTDRIMGNVHMLPSIKNSDALPYQHLDGRKEFFMKDLPDCLTPKEKYSANDKLSCHFCREKVKLSQMRNHVGGHILGGLQGVEDKKIEKFWERKNRQQASEEEDEPEQLGENPCGFCGRDGCFTNLLEKKSGNSISITVTSNCPYHYERMQYKQAATFSNTMPCTNVPIHCPLCPTSISGNPQTIWKYNALYHLITEHSNGDTVPEIPGELLVKMFIHQQEEKALGIGEEYIQQWRMENKIPDSDGLKAMMEDQQKRQIQFLQLSQIGMMKKEPN